MPDFAGRVYGIFVGCGGLFEDGILICVPLWIELLFGEAGILTLIIDDGEQLPQTQQQQAEQNNASNNDENNDKNGQRRRAIFLLLDPNRQIVCAIVVVQEIECAVVGRINKLTLIPCLAVRNVQHRQLLYWNNCEWTFGTFGLVIRAGPPLLAHHTRLVFNAFRWTSRADVAERSRIRLILGIRMTVAFPANTVSMSVTDLPVLGQATIRTEWTFARGSRVAFFAMTNSAIASAVTATQLTIVTRAIEVVTLTELATDNLFGIRSREARTYAAFANATARTTQTVVVFSAFSFQCDSGFTSTHTFTTFANIIVEALANAANQISVAITLRCIDND